jgi:inosine/xanthosine triphosphate pyrophosphatase family protein
MKKKLVVATNNAHKLEEIAAILGDAMELLSLKDIQCFADIPELLIHWKAMPVKRHNISILIMDWIVLPMIQVWK